MYDLMEFYPFQEEYLFYRLEFLDAMEEVSTTEYLEVQLEIALDMLHLDRNDQHRVRFRVPRLMLQLEKEAECYAFIKWCFQPHLFDEYEWGHKILPLSSFKGSDPFEAIESFCGRHAELFPLAKLAILKAKMFLNLIALDNCVLAVGNKVPPEILHMIQLQAVQSDIIENSREIREKNDHQDEIMKLKSQINVLYREVEKVDRLYWSRLKQLVTGADIILPRQATRSVHNIDVETYRAWILVPGGHEFIKR